MKITFKGLFVLSLVLSAIALYGPLAAIGVAALICFFHSTESLFLRIFLGVVILFVVGLPAVIAASVLWVISYAVKAMIEKATKKEEQIEPKADIEDAEYTVINDGK